MICSREFLDYINALGNSDDTFAGFQTAFDGIGKKFDVAKVVSILIVPANPFTRDGEERHDVAYLREDIKCADKPAYVKTTVTGEKGQVWFEVYRIEGTADFTEEEITDINAVLDVLTFHAARWRMINRIKDMQFIDGLTGLVNAGGFLTYIDAMIEQKKLSLYNSYYFNLSRFGLVNRRFGSAETDRIIVRYAEAIQDFLLPGEILGRLGGDNFIALVSKERTDMFLQFLSGVITYGVLGDKEFPVKISAVTGVVDLDDSVTDSSSVINDAAMAMNVAKHVMNQPFMYATPQMREKGYKDKQIESAFMEALYNGDFKVYYQPKVSGDEYRIVGGEALSRWFRDGAIVPPMDFIPVIEQNGSVCLLDFYVLEQVCRDITQWLKSGIKVGRISVNFSRKHLSNPHLVEDIMDVLRKYELAGRYIEIELTETVDEVESGLLVDFIKRMKYHKVRISIDDFGTGYSSLNMLRSFSVDVLKIDKSFIDDLDERNKIILSNIIRMAHDLKMEVVAEGVETKEQAVYLREIGCHVLQGYLFDKPIPKEEFEKKIYNEVYSL